MYGLGRSTSHIIATGTRHHHQRAMYAHTWCLLSSSRTHRRANIPAESSSNSTSTSRCRQDVLNMAQRPKAIRSKSGSNHTTRSQPQDTLFSPPPKSPATKTHHSSNLPDQAYLAGVYQFPMPSSDRVKHIRTRISPPSLASTQDSPSREPPKYFATNHPHLPKTALSVVRTSSFHQKLSNTERSTS